MVGKVYRVPGKKIDSIREPMAEYSTTHKALTLTEEQFPLFRQDFDEGNWATVHGNNGHLARTYDTTTFPLARHIEQLLMAKGVITEKQLHIIGGLGYLHTVLPASMTTLDKDEVNGVTRLLYEQNEAFLSCYRSLIKYICDTIIGEPCVFQATPTIRVHCPHQQGFNWLPRYHNDIILGHPPQEINIWLAFTKAYGTNTMDIAPLDASLEVLSRYHYDFTSLPSDVQSNAQLQATLQKMMAPATFSYGDILIFDSRCLHGTQYNREETTRISMDIRVTPVNAYKKRRFTYQGTGRRKMLFQQGEYYDLLTTDEL